MSHEDIRLGTLVASEAGGSYIKQILPHGFESFSITFGGDVTETDIEKLAADVNDAIGGSNALISSLGIYGNPLENGDADKRALESWYILIEHARLFNSTIIAGFTGRLRGRPLQESIGKFKEVFAPIAKNAAEKGLRIAFENCPMGGTWDTGDYNIAHNPSAWKLMFDSVSDENVGLQWEPCHQMVQLIDPLPQIEKWIDRIFHIHGKCATIRNHIISRYGISSPERFAFHRTPGFGDLNWKDVISELRRAGFRGSIDIEGWHDPVYRDELEMTGQVAGLNYLKACRGSDYVANPDV